MHFFFWYYLLNLEMEELKTENLKRDEHFQLYCIVFTSGTTGIGLLG